MSAIARREFLSRSAGAMVIAFTWSPLAVSPSAQRINGDSRVVPARTTLGVDELDSWLAISADGKVTVFTGRIDMGTGVETSFAQLVADELDVPYDAVTIVMGDTGLTPDQGKSTASNNSSRGAQPLLIATAEARSALLTLAGDWLEASVDELIVRDGVVSVQWNPTNRVAYGELLKGRRFDRRVKVTSQDPWGPVLETSAKLKSGNFRYVGKSLVRRDVPAKVMGTAPFVHTVRVSGMVHGRVVRPPRIGATLLSVDEASVRNVPGLIKVVRQGNFLGVVAEREEHAAQAARQLKGTWRGGTPIPDVTDMARWLKRAKRLRTDRAGRGDVDAALARAATVLEATYEWPVQNHAMIGPSCAVADVRPGQVTVWTGSQWVQQNRRDLAQFLSVPLETVRLIWVKGAGGVRPVGVR